MRGQLVILMSCCTSTAAGAALAGAARGSPELATAGHAVCLLAATVLYMLNSAMCFGVRPALKPAGLAAGAALAAAALGTPDLAAAGRAGFLLAATVLGFLAGSALPPAAVRVAHPLVVCAAAANLGAATLGALTGAGYLAALRTFLTKVCFGSAHHCWGRVCYLDVQPCHAECHAKHTLRAHI